jgi:hypothetical protein
MKSGFHFATTLHGSAALPFVISTAAQRRDLCVDALTWKCFSTQRIRISCHTATDTTAHAAFIKESRTKFINATNLNRKSGVAQWGDLRFLSYLARGCVRS